MQNLQDRCRLLIYDLPLNSVLLADESMQSSVEERYSRWLHRVPQISSLLHFARRLSTYLYLNTHSYP